MKPSARPARLMTYLAGTLAAATLMGADCIPLPFGPPVTANTVTIEMLNYTDYDVEPRLFIDPVPGIMVYGQLIRDDNWVLVDPPLASGEIARYEFLCQDVGTMASDYAQMYLSDVEYVESDNGPWLVRSQDFLCGDTVSLMFIDELIGDEWVFYTRVEVNGQFLTD